MTEMDEACASAMAAVTSINRQLSTWLIDAALPVWDEHGVDRCGGGYYETLLYDESTRCFEARGTLRRGRVVARQIYVFGVGEARGWRSARSSPLAHGCEHLFSRFYLGDGVFHTAIDARTGEPGSPFSLYEQSFYLFALARVTAAFGQRYPVAESALRCLQRLRGRFANERGGFYETDPPELPLKSNPHMHLLEAALEWVENTDGHLQRAWIALAQEIVGLCLTHFRDARSGAVREYFDFQWQAIPGDDGRIVEPGHQFEWAWLLLRWAASPHCEAGEAVVCREAAARLIELAEEHGVDANRGVAINEIWDDMTAKDQTAKLWPQTERLKA
ncbi:MAG: AGE family epimerase/isomerase, partial [Pseudomonadota bacterium]|nr:AGE family epimerase/isomerase [Pseudomonadota bacterium]